MADMNTPSIWRPPDLSPRWWPVFLRNLLVWRKLAIPSLVGNIAEPVWNRWRGELAEIGGRSPLLHFNDEPRTRIELSQAHPSGLPQFITGKSTLLSNLIRDELALRNARLAAGEITQKGIELRSMRGIESVHLAIGLAHGQQLEA